MAYKGDLLSFMKLQGISKKQSFTVLLEALVHDKLKISKNGEVHALKDIDIAILMDLVGQEIGYRLCDGDWSDSNIDWYDMMQCLDDKYRDCVLVIDIESSNPIYVYD